VAGQPRGCSIRHLQAQWTRLGTNPPWREVFEDLTRHKRPKPGCQTAPVKLGVEPLPQGQGDERESPASGIRARAAARSPRPYVRRGPPATRESNAAGTAEVLVAPSNKGGGIGRLESLALRGVLGGRAETVGEAAGAPRRAPWNLGSARGKSEQGQTSIQFGRP